MSNESEINDLNNQLASKNIELDKIEAKLGVKIDNSIEELEGDDLHNKQRQFQLITEILNLTTKRDKLKGGNPFG